MIGNVKFLLERNVLHLVYLQVQSKSSLKNLDHYSLSPNLAPSLIPFQTVLWLSYFFSPVMTLVAVIVFFLFFYIYLFRLRVSMVILRDSFDFCIIPGQNLMMRD